MTMYNRALVDALVRRFTRRNQTSTVRVVRMDEPSLDVGSNDLSAVPGQTIYEGIGRVYGISGPLTYALGEEPQYFSSTYVSIPDTHPDDSPTRPRVDDVVEVLTSHDPTIVGRRFRVTDVADGGQFTAYVRMSVTGVQASKRWSDPVLNPQQLTVPDEWIIDDDTG